MSVTSQIGAGHVILMGDAADPATADVPVQTYMKSFSIATAMGTVDVTKLDADQNAYFRQHIAGLRDATFTGNWGDDTAGTFERAVDAIQAASVSPTPRGACAFIVRPAGTGSGKIQYTFTAFITALNHDGGVEDESGGSFSGQITGAVTKATQ